MRRSRSSEKKVKSRTGNSEMRPSHDRGRSSTSSGKRPNAVATPDQQEPLSISRAEDPLQYVTHLEEWSFRLRLRLEAIVQPDAKIRGQQQLKTVKGQSPAEQLSTVLSKFADDGDSETTTEIDTAIRGAANTFLQIARFEAEMQDKVAKEVLVPLMKAEKSFKDFNEKAKKILEKKEASVASSKTKKDQQNAIEKLEKTKRQLGESTDLSKLIMKQDEALASLANHQLEFFTKTARELRTSMQKQAQQLRGNK